MFQSKHLFVPVVDVKGSEGFMQVAHIIAFYKTATGATVVVTTAGSNPFLIQAPYEDFLAMLQTERKRDAGTGGGERVSKSRG